MRTSTLLMAIFGCYMVAVGLCFYLVPAFTLKLIHFPPNDDDWIRFMGLVLAIVGFYYLVAAKKQLNSFYYASVWGRYLVFIGTIILVVKFDMHPFILVIAGNDIIWATITLYFLNREVKSQKISRA